MNCFTDGYSDKDIKYQWEKGDSRVSLDDKVKKLPQYNITSFTTATLFNQYVTGIVLYQIKKCAAC